jgi:phosphoglycerate dehydrogenase-like enzyme
LDVTDPEPLPADHPLWDAPGLLLTPHVGGAVPGFPRRAYALVREQLGRWARDEPLQNVVSDGY